MSKSNRREVVRPGSSGKDPETLDMFATKPEPAPRSTVHKGKARKDRIMSETEIRKKAAIEWLRERLVDLYHERRRRADATRQTLGTAGVPYVSADDAREIYRASKFPVTYSTTLSFAGSIFRDRRFIQTGDRIVSRHPENNGRKIDCWKVAE